MSTDDKNLRRFNGEDDDPGKALKKWKLWAKAKMLTFKDFKPEQEGPWIFTLLDGRAWDACEHLTLEDLSKADGAAKLWKVLESRFPEKEAFDQLGEALGSVFSLAAQDGEDLKTWAGRVRDTFDQCARKGQLTFPGEAKGWILLHCAGLSEGQRAIVKAKTQGELEFSKVAQALRSCFPDYKAPAGKKRAVGVFQVDEVTDQVSRNYDELDDEYIHGVEAFLSEHQTSTGDHDDDDVFSEGEVAEALAVSWGERRREIAKLRQSRQFGGVNKEKRSFKVEVEELKKRTRCRRCLKIGHWARECRNPPADKSQSQSAQASSSSATGAGYVQHVDDPGEEMTPSFVGAAELLLCEDENKKDAAHQVLASGLVSSPGFGVIDSGCGKTLIGSETLARLETMIYAAGFGSVKRREEANLFRFGNGMTERSTEVATIPVGIAKTYGTIDAAVIEGQAPLLLGRPTLVKMGVHLDFTSNVMSFMDQSTKMEVNSAGQLLVDLMDFPEKPHSENMT